MALDPQIGGTASRFSGSPCPAIRRDSGEAVRDGQLHTLGPSWAQLWVSDASATSSASLEARRIFTSHREGDFWASTSDDRQCPVLSVPNSR